MDVCKIIINRLIVKLVGDDETARCAGCELLALSAALAWVGIALAAWWI